MPTSDVNPYASTTETEHAGAMVTEASLWRRAVMLVSLFVSSALVILACYGVWNLHWRGWTHTTGQTLVILAALGMFVVAAMGFAAFGIGVRRHREAMALTGIITIILATIIYFLLFLIAN